MGLLTNNDEARARAIYEKELVQNELKEAYTQSQIYNSMSSDDKQDSIYVLIDNGAILKEVEMHLRGYAPERDTETGGTIWKKKFAPVMNDEGIQTAIQELTGRVGKNAILSNISEEKAGLLTVHMCICLSRAFMAYSQKYELDEVTRSNVLAQITDMVYFSLTRGIDGIERENAYKNRKTIEHRQPDGTPIKKGGIFNLMN